MIRAEVFVINANAQCSIFLESRPSNTAFLTGSLLSAPPARTPVPCVSQGRPVNKVSSSRPRWQQHSVRTMARSDGVYHKGELAVQQKAGTAEQAARNAPFVRRLVNQQLSLFAEERSDVIAASADSEGRLWASMLFGSPGFMRVTPDSTALLVGADKVPAVSQEDPLLENAQVEGAPLGFLMIEMQTRRRNRINGFNRPARASPGGLFVQVEEAFGNCPKYITRRRFSSTAEGGLQRQPEGPPMRSQHLTASQQRLIAQSDMLFVATANPGGGADASHRGGFPGFVRVLDDKTLLWPDYVGNGMFMTEGNLLVNPCAGLLFADWPARSLLQLTGRAQVLFDDDIQQVQLEPLLDGAERGVLFKLDEALFRPGSIPFDYQLVDYSPYNLPVQGPSLKAQDSGKTQQIAKVVGIKQVTPLVKEFTFETEEELQYLPGQYAMINLQLPRKEGGGTEQVTRTWTITSTAKPGKRSFSIAVKRLPGGRASVWLHDVVQPGTTVQLVSAAGDFTCFESQGVVKARRLLLLSGGIGVTPMLAMLRGLREAPPEQLDVVGVHTARTGTDVPFRSEMSVEASDDGGRFKFIENLTERDGRLTEEWLRSRVSDVVDRQVYLCGPTGYMNHLTAILEALGVPANSIHTESFSY